MNKEEKAHEKAVKALYKTYNAYLLARLEEVKSREATADAEYEVKRTAKEYARAVEEEKICKRGQKC